MEAQTVTAVASAALAALSAAVSVYYSHKSTQHAQLSAQNQYEDHMRGWAERTVDITGQLVELVSNPGGENEFNGNRSQLLAVLRCQIDKGRWYFPNIHSDKKGPWKPPAFRGIRQPIIEFLVSLFQAVKNAEWNDRESVCKKVEGFHREFVSEIQQRLDPSARDANYRKYVGQYQDLTSQFVAESLQRPDRPPGVLDRSQPVDESGSRAETSTAD